MLEVVHCDYLSVYRCPVKHSYNLFRGKVNVEVRRDALKISLGQLASSLGVEEAEYAGDSFFSRSLAEILSGVLQKLFEC